ncbi:MAG TPA: hypothetical protein VGS19_17870 [Streptosporangiaceae bacterium]|nr:hypothetical protein [Streptosporangiaceae bacterium]
MLEEALADQPVVARDLLARRLGEQPAPVSAPDGCGGVSPAGWLQLVSEQSLRGEQGHLCVVGDRSGPAVAGYVPGDPGRAVLATDLGQGKELDTCAERITYRAAEQAATVPVTQCRHWAPSTAIARAGWPGSAPIRMARTGSSG